MNKHEKLIGQIPQVQQEFARSKPAESGILTKTLQEAIDDLRALHVTICGAPHEGGIPGYRSNTSCVLREGNLVCGHPELGLHKKLRSYLWLAHALGAPLNLSKNVGEGGVNHAMQVLEDLTEGSSGLRGMDRGAQNLLGGAHHHADLIHPMVAKAQEDASLRSAVDGRRVIQAVQGDLGRQMTDFRDRIVSALESVIEPPSWQEKMRSWLSQHVTALPFLFSKRSAGFKPASLPEELSTAIERFRSVPDGEQELQSARAEIARYFDDPQNQEKLSMVIRACLHRDFNDTSEYEVIGDAGRLVYVARQEEEWRTVSREEKRQIYALQQQMIFTVLRRSHQKRGLPLPEATSLARSETKMIFRLGLVTTYSAEELHDDR